MPSTYEHVNNDPRFGVTHDGEEGLKVIETERSPVAPLPGLILERPRESR